MTGSSQKPLREASLAIVDPARAKGAKVIGEVVPDSPKVLTGRVDEAIRTGFAASRYAAQPGVALVALGGYGRRRLSPYSDVDLMIFIDKADKARADELVKTVFYPLWDAGIDVGHSVMTPSELAAACRRFEDLTSFLSARLIAGDEKLFDKLGQAAAARCRKLGPKRFARLLLAANEERYGKMRRDAFLLEPDIKNGMGALRDIHSLLWLDLAFPDAGYLSPTDHAWLAEAESDLLSIRSQLHLDAGRRSDRLFMEAQERLAAGRNGHGGSRSVEQFMRNYYLNAQRIDLTLSCLLNELTEEKAVLEPMDAESPLGFIGRACARRGWPSRSAMLHLSGEEGPSGDLEELLPLLRAGDEGTPYLELANALGLLDRLLPGWSDIRCLPLFDRYHLYTVDVHSFLCAAGLAEMLAGRVEGPARSAAEESAPDGEPLLLAGLLHDIGKGGGGDHSSRGARLAARILAGRPDAEMISNLIRDHLLFPDTATRRDASEEATAGALAGHLEDVRRSRLLYLLGIADSLATGPKAWSPVKGALVDELFLKSQAVLENPNWTRTRSERVERKRRALVRALSDAPAAHPRPVDYAEALAPGYLDAFPSDELARHYVLAYSSGRSTGLELRTKGGYIEVLCWADRPSRFLSRIAGLLTCHDMNIHDAGVYSLPENIELGRLLVQPIFEKPEPKRLQAVLEEEFSLALADRISLDRRVGSKRNTYITHREDPGPVEVAEKEGISAFHTVIEVRARDRIGLLYDISRAFDEFRLDIRKAKVSTAVDDIIDIFYLLDESGEVIRDPSLLGEICEAARYAVRGAWNG